MSEINLSSKSSETLELSEPEPSPVATDDDLLKSIERAEKLWTTFSDAQMRQSEKEMEVAIEALQTEYAGLKRLISNTAHDIDPDILTLALDELSYDDVLEKMERRAGSVNRRLFTPPNLGSMDYFVL